MSREISNVFQTYFDAEVKRSYGDKRMLAGTMYEKSGVVGESAYFRKKGKGLATRHNAGAEVTYMNTAFSQVECPLEGWEAFDSADKFDATAINFSEVSELAEVAGDAIGLRMDQLVIDALDAGYDSVNNTVGTVGTALTVSTLTAGKKLLDKKGVDSNGRTFIHNADQLEDLLNETKVTSSDYNSVKALVAGEVGSFLGLNFICLADRLEGGLPNPGATSIRGFIYHNRSVGFAVGMNMETEMTWIPKERAYMVGAEFKAGSVVIDQDGIVAVESLID